MLVFEKQEKDSKHMPSLGKMMILILTYKICRNLPSDQPHCSKCLGVLRTLVGDTKWTGAAHSLKKKSLLKWRTIVYTTHPEQVYHLLVQPLLSAAGCWNILFVLNVCAVLVRKQSRERSSMTSFSWVAGELLYPSEYLRGNLGRSGVSPDLTSILGAQKTVPAISKHQRSAECPHMYMKPGEHPTLGTSGS